MERGAQVSHQVVYGMLSGVLKWFDSLLIASF